MKKCPRCDSAKPLAEFHRNRSRPDGHAQYCKPCAREVWGRYERQKRTSAEFNAAKARKTAEWIATHRAQHDATARAHTAGKQDATIPMAKRAGRRWTGPELEWALREDLPVDVAARALGRSYIAVVKARQRGRSDSRYIALAGVSR